MRLLEVLLLFSCFQGLGASAILPRLVSIQILRCPIATYNNFVTEEQTKAFNTPPYSDSYRTEFDEVLRFLPNETGTIQMFITGQGNFSVRLSADEKVFESFGSVVHADPHLGGILAQYPLKVRRGVLESFIDVIMISENIRKTTRVYVSTTSLEPPRPPSLYTSLLLSEEEIVAGEAIAVGNPDAQGSSSQDEQVTPAPENTPSIQYPSTATTTASNSSIQIVNFPPVQEILNGTHSKPYKTGLRLMSIGVQRVSEGRMEQYSSKTNKYFLLFSGNEHGFIKFYVAGRGEKTVTVQSITIENHIAKVMQVDHGVAAFPYRVTDKTGNESILVKVENTFNDVIYFYINTRKRQYAASG